MSLRSSLEGGKVGIIKEKSRGISMEVMAGLYGKAWGVQACVGLCTHPCVNVFGGKTGQACGMSPQARGAQNFSSS